MSSDNHEATLASRINDLYNYRKNHLTGDEKGESQVFLERLFQAFGHAGYAEVGAKLEYRIKGTTTSFADLVWKPRVLIEMKKAGSDLSRHYQQAFNYWMHAVPHRPRYVVLCNFDQFWIYDFDHQLDEPVDKVSLEELRTRWEPLAFLLPEDPKPQFRRDMIAVTRNSAAQMAHILNELVTRGVERESAQRYVLQCVMAMFAEDIRLFPSRVFSQTVDDIASGGNSYDLIGGLFREMNTKGTTPAGRYAGTPYFNGGLYSVVEPVELEKSEIQALLQACATDWSQVRPEIFGTLFEQSLDKPERHAYGAHFTHPADIAHIVGPCIVTPWREAIAAARSIGELEALHSKLLSYRVLDPACGCGNFLYVAYRELRRIERELLEAIDVKRRGRLETGLSLVSPEQFYGIDIRPFAVDIAKVTLLIAKKLAADELGDNQQVLPLDNLDGNIQTADALFTSWPKADVIIGNPPYLGRRKVIRERGAGYSDLLRREYPNVSGVADYVCYWFPIAHDHLPPGGRAGLVGTNSIRQGHGRKASLDYIADHGGILFDAVPTQPWSGDAKVHVSIVNWSKGKDVEPKVLWMKDGMERLQVPKINTALSLGIDVKDALNIRANMRPKVCFQGQTTGMTDVYELTPERASEFLSSDARNRRAVHPMVGGKDLIESFVANRWVIDVPSDTLEEAQAFAPEVFAYLKAQALPRWQEAAEREKDENGKRAQAMANPRVDLSRAKFLNHWWTHWRRRSDLITELEKLDRYICVTRTGSFDRMRVFSFVDATIRPSDSVVAFTFDDDYSLGILQSSCHLDWFRARCTTLKADPSYTNQTVFNSFPWPQDATSGQMEAVASAMAEILTYRVNTQSTGHTLVDQYDVLRTPGAATLRKLHENLDKAVARSYGFVYGSDYVAQLLELNEAVGGATDGVRGPGPVGALRLTDWRMSPAAL